MAARLKSCAVRDGVVVGDQTPSPLLIVGQAGTLRSDPHPGLVVNGS